MVLKLLKFCPMPTSFALAASVIYSGLSSYIPDYDTETKRYYKEKADYFEQLSCDILEGVSEINRVNNVCKTRDISSSTINYYQVLPAQCDSLPVV